MTCSIKLNKNQSKAKSRTVNKEHQQINQNLEIIFYKYKQCNNNKVKKIMKNLIIKYNTAQISIRNNQNSKHNNKTIFNITVKIYLNTQLVI